MDINTYTDARSLSSGKRPAVCPGCCGALIRAGRALPKRRPCLDCRNEALAGGAR